MKLEPYIPTTLQSFWCTKCDRNIVDSGKPDSGTFHIQFGHSFNSATKSFDGDGPYLGVMFAACKDCV